MSWSISITAEGWQDIYDTLETWTRENLIAALIEDIGKDDDPDFNYCDVSDDILVDIAFERIQAVNTCDNGGNGYYIDEQGYHRVYTT